MSEIVSEILAYVGMASILLAFLLETRNALSSKGTIYLLLMAIGSGLLAIRAYLIGEWAFFILEIVWCGAACIALISTKISENQPSS
jgi:hypothetical protein|tara:strand:+ start:2735 stop:2995 length:261 start_codon:yes stop_codon:yes gene_type:complete